MSKEEEINKKILKASDDYMYKRVEDGCGYTGCVQPAFIEGAEWGYNQAEQDLMEKAKQWFTDNIPSEKVQLLWCDFEQFIAKN